tara:strand:+ start:39342 stop:39815 length:474 start_codon:yes stop_codon:yes gene_type:complete
MTKNHHYIRFKRLGKNEPLPYGLLLLADPSKEMIDSYVKDSDVFVTLHNEDIVGVVVLLSLTTDEVEIKNIAVKPDFQGEGIGSYLIENVINIAKHKMKKNIFIGTSNSSVGQLSLYQKFGFEIVEIKKDYFIENYTDAIYEYGIQAKHLLVLKMDL